MTDEINQDAWEETKKAFVQLVNHKHETNQHMATFYHYGSQCESIVEFGVDFAVSSWAWVACRPKFLRCVDVQRKQGLDGCHWDAIERVAPQLGIDFAFEIADTGHGALLRIKEERLVGFQNEEILHRDPYVLPQDVDLLYIDTYHSYTHLKAELAAHGHRVKKYLIFHDTTTYGEWHGLDRDQGLNFAIDEFLQDNPYWKKIFKVDYSHGLTVLANTLNIDDPGIGDAEHHFPMPDWASDLT